MKHPLSKIQIDDPIVDMSNRTKNALQMNSVQTIGGLLKKCKLDVWEMDGIGEKGLKEIEEYLKNNNLELRWQGMGSSPHKKERNLISYIEEELPELCEKVFRCKEKDLYISFNEFQQQFNSYKFDLVGMFVKYAQLHFKRLTFSELSFDVLQNEAKEIAEEYLEEQRILSEKNRQILPN